MFWLKNRASTVMVLLIACSLGHPYDVQAQREGPLPGGPRAGSGGVLPIMIGLVDDLGNDTARSLIIRKGTGRALDVVLVTEETTPADLNKAVIILLNARRSKTKVRGRRGEIRGFVGEATRDDNSDLQFAESELARLRTAGQGFIKDFGRVRRIVSPVRSDS